ncbi:ferrochelatase [Auraticoccus sp. F435]|uniref:Coproporphyrin III ferrochelatase n=1 Tax=Auraticoccus cholistanensis TaxID=2656650 RepID=A0A6A9US34_9ACTN|nr:ferrochelatase [Auraticoccus cholistanensis]MVA75726.1 ferrochelatase [Auraticoccus cholistanensis]
MSSSSPGHGLAPYDALLLVSFGGPEAPEEVMPFLRQVTGGRGIPEERLTEVAGHYLAFGGRSPINDQCRDLLAALRAELAGRGLELPLYWGNRNTAPWLGETMAEIARDGHRRVLAITTSAYPSYSSCRQYRENLWDAWSPVAAAGTELQVDRVRNYAQHPGFVDANLAAVREAVERLSDEVPHLLFVTHSLPTAMAETAGPPPRSETGSYVDWHQSVAQEITWQLRQETGVAHPFDLVYCSRSGPPSQPWLEPDINDRMAELAAAGVRSVVVAPIGFVSDHMEVVFDLDTEARETAEELGLRMERAATAGTHPAFVSGLVDLALERAAVARGEPAAPSVIEGGSPGLVVCPVGCCPNLREPGRPALCGAVAPG